MPQYKAAIHVASMNPSSYSASPVLAACGDVNLSMEGRLVTIVTLYPFGNQQRRPCSSEAIERSSGYFRILRSRSAQSVGNRIFLAAGKPR